MVNWGIYCTDGQKEREGNKGNAKKTEEIPISAFFGHKDKGTRTVVIKTNYLKTRGVHKYKLLDPRKEFGKIKKHIDYIGREENIFYDKEGNKVSKEKVWEEIKVKNPFIIHRMVLSPWKKLEDEQFKAFVKYEILALRKMLDGKKKFDYFYAKHDGDYSISANVILYSNNQLFIRDYTLAYMKEAGNEFMEELEKGKILLEPEGWLNL